MSTGEGDSNETDDEDKDGGASEMSPRQGMELCEQLERLCLVNADVEGIDALSLQQQLRKLQGHLCQLDFNSCKQVTLDCFLASHAHHEDVVMS